jgi:drug/metabolite transporter (DMT)-like permease
VSASGGAAEVRAGDSAARGYVLVTVAYLVFGSLGALINYANAPASALLVLRFGIATIVLAALFARSRLWAEYRRPGIWRLLLAMGAVDGYLEPLSAPLYALVLLGERPTSWALGGGVLILAAGMVVILFGEREERGERGESVEATPA